MIVPDVNVLVHAYKREAEHHPVYAAWLQELVNGDEDLGLLDVVLAGVVRVVTHPRVFETPAPTVDALAYVEALRSAPRARSLPISAASWARVGLLAAQDRHLRGNVIPDGVLAAVALAHGGEVATADRGFARFPSLRWFDPVERAR